MGRLSRYKHLKNCHQTLSKLISAQSDLAGGSPNEANLVLSLLEFFPSKPWIVLTGGHKCMAVAQDLFAWLGWQATRALFHPRTQRNSKLSEF